MSFQLRIYGVLTLGIPYTQSKRLCPGFSQDLLVCLRYANEQIQALFSSFLSFFSDLVLPVSSILFVSLPSSASESRMTLCSVSGLSFLVSLFLLFSVSSVCCVQMHSVFFLQLTLIVVTFLIGSNWSKKREWIKMFAFLYKIPFFPWFLESQWRCLTSVRRNTLTSKLEKPVKSYLNYMFFFLFCWFILIVHLISCNSSSKWCAAVMCSACPSPWRSPPCSPQHPGCSTASRFPTSTSWYD